VPHERALSFRPRQGRRWSPDADPHRQARPRRPTPCRRRPAAPHKSVRHTAGRRGRRGDGRTRWCRQVGCRDQAQREAVAIGRSITTTPTMRSVGCRAVVWVNPFRRYTAMAGSIAPRTVSSHTVWQPWVAAVATAASMRASAMPASDRPEIHPLELGVAVVMEVDGDGAHGDRSPVGEEHGGVDAGVVVGEVVELADQGWLLGDGVEVGEAAHPLDVVVQQRGRFIPVGVSARPADCVHRNGSLSCLRSRL
jgi:hypothetical protein